MERTLIDRLALALRDLLDQVQSLDDFTLTRDVEPYKAEACWDDVIREGLDAIHAWREARTNDR